MDNFRFVFNDSESLLSYLNQNQEFRSTFRTKLFQVKKVSHGYANLVYRLIFADLSTAILKYYSPRVAGSNGLIELSQNRYHVEKNALMLIGNETASMMRNGMIRIPKVYTYDDSQCFIVMEDCGEHLVPLAKLFRNDFKPVKQSNEPSQFIVEDFLKKLASHLKILFKSLTFDFSIKPETHATLFANKQYWEGMNHNYESICREVADVFGLESELSEYLDSGIRLEQPRENAKFIHGNLEPNSFLVDLEKHQVWLLDWELARFDSEYRDVEVLSFILWLMKQNPKQFDTRRIDYFEKRLQYEFIGDELIDWRSKLNKSGKVNFIVMLMTALIMPDNFGTKLENPRETALKAIRELKNF